MSAKPTWRVPSFGAQLRAARGKLSLRRVVQMLQAKGFPESIGPSTLKRYEDGRAPDVVVLWGLSQIYQADPGALLTAIAREALGTSGTETGTLGQVTLEELEHLQAWRQLSASGRQFVHDALQDRLHREQREHPPTVTGARKGA